MKICPSSRKLPVLLLALLSGAGAYLVVQRRSSLAEVPAESPAPAPTDARTANPPAPVPPAPTAAEAPDAPEPAGPVEPAEPVGRHLADVPAEEVGDDAAEGLAPGPFGPGSAAPREDGAAPGAAYTIKGNADSMLFHGPESPYYGRTKAEVWFVSVEAAHQAGFTGWNEN